MEGNTTRYFALIGREFRYYALAILSVGVAYGITHLFAGIFRTSPYMLFWGAVLFSAMFGLGPALLALVLSILAVEIFKTGTLSLAVDATTLIQHVIFALLGGLATLAVARYQNTRQAMKAVLESAIDFAIFSIDLSGTITSWNEGARYVFGYEDNQIRGQHLRVLFTPEDRAEGIPEEELHLAATQGVAIDDRWQMRKNGEHFYATGVVRPICERGGKIVGFVKVLRDRTQRRILEQERAEALIREQEARNRLEEINRVILHFVAVISHEVRSPLTTIKGFIDTLRAEDVTWKPEQQREFLDIMALEADRLDRLTADLLDYTRLETGMFRVSLQETTLDAVFAAARPQLTALVSDLHPFEVRLPNPSPPIKVDVERIVQVLVNLVGNSARYAADQTPIHIFGEVVGSEVRVDVIDKGPGIPHDKRNHIFTPFEQLGIDQRRETKGAGLGLSIARGIVESHGGRIWIEDHGDPGTIVSFTLPLDLPPAETPSSHEPDSDL